MQLILNFDSRLISINKNKSIYALALIVLRQRCDEVWQG